MENYIQFSEEVEKAKEEGKAIVALESTIISHGMPYPQNVEMAQKVEQIVRDNGGVPATIAIIDGKIKIGLSEDELELLASAENVSKVSRRDIAEILATKKIGATTVASTMICAQLADIKFFVTGGIGGVHKGAEHTMDISADLDELSKTKVAVICAGAKSILDLDKTLEYLETKGVPVVGYQTDELPAFFTRESGLKLNTRIDEVSTIAKLAEVQWDLGLETGIVVANPVPEEDQLEPSFINGIIDKAVAKAEEEGIHGKDSTPFLLGEIVKQSEGKSLETNIKLVEHNAKIGTQIAVEYTNLQN
ncbi:MULTISPECIES: pseudouridine-5'-phosphate glycosidase [Mammaliicoccus]|jgi:pseudouridine-5'-phosphate glycosidase|uniref:Pseudouridine-5'-phosphate glycosidase n=2 Tax=Mammaliicoccus sciuri TaxID=1296 RepID=A0AAW5LF83_MAMSC|nr:MULTISPECIES: pseudouridine-5'-phosphate glycosidase [Mammaliicoccus]MBA1396092.1 pseudouridine-5-phosphate glycosidase [Mammaliicoccus sciuri]MBF0773122.1 pseudouridine-5'-phosphate glycosidase [Mammaliicoccus sciuri]MBG9205563.1 pseudouridine-5'-phosphate glycosidase [Mammaliicoccus sciuri]MBG9209673.1 pseudouridine-5'-phosphate glycosidase [Mammaliicoccus sciuri]MBU6088359.1 pseudouridine-5'-phosphate glycosidase [Mammaliicoccus sciuri]